jgi:hypothetical protein
VMLTLKHGYLPSSRLVIRLTSGYAAENVRSGRCAFMRGAA